MQQQTDDKDSSHWTGNGQEYDDANRATFRQALTKGGVACVLGGAVGQSLMMGHWIVGGMIAIMLLSLGAYNLSRSSR